MQDGLSLLCNYRDSHIFDNIALNREFYDEKWTKNRVVTSLDWSTQVYIVFSLMTYTNTAVFTTWQKLGGVNHCLVIPFKTHTF